MKNFKITIVFQLTLIITMHAFSQNYHIEVKTIREQFKNGQFAEASKLCEKWLPLIKEKYGVNDTTYFELCLLSGESFYQIGNFAASLTLLEEAKNISQTIYGKRHSYYIRSLNDLAMLNLEMGNYDASLSLLKESTVLSKEVLGTKHADYATSINGLASLYFQLGNYDAALPLLDEAKEIIQETLGKKHPDYAVALNNLAALNSLQGNYEVSLALYIEALNLKKEILGIRNPSYAYALNSLAELYRNMGNYEAALPLYEEAKKILFEVLGTKNSDYASSINGLAMVNYLLGKYQIALPLFQESCSLVKEILGTKHPYYATSIDNLATLYEAMGNYEAALPLFIEARDVRLELLGPEHYEFARSMNNLGGLYSRQGKYKEALELYEQAVDINKKTLGIEHPTYTIFLNNLAGIYEKLGNVDSALALYKETNTITNQKIQQNFAFLSEKEKTLYLNTVAADYELYLSFLKKYYPKFPEFTINLYNNEIILKELILTYTSAVQRSIYENEDTTLSRKYEQLRSLKDIIISQQQKPLSKRQQDFSEITQKANDLERDFSHQYHAFNDILLSFKIKWEDVQKNLSSNEAAVEFVSFNYYDKKFTDSTFYCALVLRSNDTLPKMVYLCEEFQLNKAIPSSSGTAFKVINSSYTGQSLYNLIWKPIDSLLQGINTLYFAPSGLLNSVSMAAISCPDNKTLMEKYKLIQLSSTRTLALTGESEPINNAVVYGGIMYDTDTTTLLAKAEKYHKKDSGLLAYNRSSTWDNRSGFRYLPGTQKEAELISAKLKKNKISITSYSGTDALEESFTALSGKTSPSIIHISTHGFYYPDTISEKLRKHMNLSGSGEVQFRYSHDPLLRSGLLMAGANLAWKGAILPANVEDGILTAKEVSNMNLMNTELVVLSACQTGQGDVKGSEGVEGLQRGFKMAGVRYLIMSLWEVPDKETTEFMDTFYDNWLGGKEIHEAFRDTQARMHKMYKDEPFKWAGFVLVE
ncbi:MAG: CHAT domain-containing tetratricopeptide repeat protein [Bacteroidota bacterium]